ncbi:pyridoxal phosphate-dependent class II aminotransferase [Paradesulfitobacterium aromaticivorans]
MHGGNLRWAQETYGHKNFIDLSANINSFGPPASVWTALTQALPDIVNYPDPASKLLRTTLARTLEVPVEQILVGNGAGELIYTVVNALKPKKVAVPVPAFSEYERAARAVQAEIVNIPLGAYGWGSLPPLNSPQEQDVFVRAWQNYLTGCDLLFLCSPHNPTASVLPHRYFSLLLDIAYENECQVILDESFLDFVPDSIRWSGRTELNRYPNLIILYSLTKFYSLPGLRLGILMAKENYVSLFKEQRDPWSVNVLAQKAGGAALEEADFAAETREKVAQARAYLYSEFARQVFPSLEILPSVVNFALIKILDRQASLLVRQLGERGILVRDCTNFKGLTGEFIRIAIKDIPLMQELIQALADIYGARFL